MKISSLPLALVPLLIGATAFVTFDVRPLASPTIGDIAHPALSRPLSVQAPESNREYLFGGAPMLYVPAGEFEMGSDSNHADESPAHTVYLDAYWIDKYELTNAQYAECVEAGICTRPAVKASASRDSYYDDPQYAQYPVVNVTWDQANVYCNWNAKHLPTEAQWEKAARGTDARSYPWGNTWNGAIANSCDKNCPFSARDDKSDDGYSDTAPVSSYGQGASPYGVLNLSGNVWEWVQDWYDESYYSVSPEDNPTGPLTGRYRVLRGGAWDNGADSMRTSFRYRHFPQYRREFFGFRCAR